ncbi:hypothetical protein [Vibrio owensii]|uniref:hypothetical protein n=1 Tax=Vibrio harveyi group TaxID=717610 RepID=UPI003CC50EDD
MKDKFKKVIRKVEENYEKAIAIRNKNLLRMLCLWLATGALYACHYYEVASGFAYLLQVLFVIVSIPFAIIGFGIFFIEFWFMSKVDAAVSVASRGSMVAEIAIGEVKDRVIDHAVESSREKAKA